MANPSPPDPERHFGETEEGAKMSFFEHLTELRKRLIYSAVAIAVGALLGFTVAERVFGLIARPMQLALRDAHLDDRLIYTSPTGAINLIITLALYIGVVIASPVVLYQIWLFIAPGLYKRERRAVLTFVGSSVFLFISGIAFGYFVMLPYVLKFLIGFHSSYFRPLISINEYFDLILVVFLGLGCIFELPILIFFLALFNIVTPRFLWKNLRYAVLVIAVLAAVITPTPDATTMLIFMAPMLLLYFIGIAVSAFVFRRKRRAEAMARGGD
jgi:sec-independent protein translocase protein TatC